MIRLIKTSENLKFKYNLFEDQIQVQVFSKFWWFDISNWDRYRQTVYSGLNAGTWIIIGQFHFLAQTLLCFFEPSIEWSYATLRFNKCKDLPLLRTFPSIRISNRKVFFLSFSSAPLLFSSHTEKYDYFSYWQEKYCVTENTWWRIFFLQFKCWKKLTNFSRKNEITTYSSAGFSSFSLDFHFVHVLWKKSWHHYKSLFFFFFSSYFIKNSWYLEHVFSFLLGFYKSFNISSFFILLHSSFFILYSLFFILHSSFFILHSSFFILHSSFFILHSSFFILHSTFFILHSSFFIFHSSFFILHSSFFILHSSFFILHSSFFILHSSFFILHSSFFILHCWFISTVMIRFKSVYCMWSLLLNDDTSFHFIYDLIIYK
jgi:hypothetical protein